MANVKFLTGTETNLLKKENGVYKNPITEGCLYVTAEKVGTEWKSALYYDTATQRIKVGGDGKAEFDAMGNNIAETYIRDISMEGTKYASTDGATLTYTKGNGATTTILLPLASDTKAGVINTAAQTFAGDKTFKGQVRIQGGTDTSGTSANSGYLLIGSPTGAHMSLDANEIQAKAASGTTAQLYINNDGGTTQFGGTVQPKSDNAYNLGGEQLRWKTIYGTTIYGTSIYGPNIHGNVTGNLTGVASNATDADKLDGYHRSDLFTSIPTWMNATGLTKTITVEGDTDKYYPVRITLSTSKEFPQLISIWKNLGSKTPSSYPGNHSNGTSSLWLRYEARSNTWDGNGGYCKTWYKHQGYATLVAHAQMAGNGVGDLIVWLRGGGCEYKISCSGTFTATVYLTETNLGSSSYPVNVGPKTTVDNGGIIEGHLGYGRVTKADKADIALKDEAERNIRTHYLSNMSFDGTTNKTTKVVAKLLNGDGGVKATIDFPTASASQAGAITTGTQTLTGAKTLDGSGSLTIQKASGFNYSGIGSGTDNTNRKVWFSHSSNTGTPVLSDKFLYNPASTDSMATVVNRVSDKTDSAYGKLTVDLLEGIAAKAYADDIGNKISDKYVASMVFSATGSEVTLKYRTIVGSDLASIAVPNASTSKAGVITTGTQSIAGNKTFTGRIYINNTSDGALATADSGALVIGNKSSEHLIIDSNEIMAKATGTTANTLNIQTDGGTTSFGGNITPKTDNSSSMNVGTSSLRWQTLYGYIFNAATKFTTGGGNFSADTNGLGYFSTALGLKVNPDTAYALKVKGNTFLNGIAYFANGTVYKIDNTGHAYLASLAVGEDSTAYKLYVGGTAYIKGDTTHAGNIYLQKNGQIFGVGSKSTTSLIRVVDNTADANGNGISIGGGGLVVIGAGESASNFVSTTGKSGGDENLHLLADSAIYLESYADTVGNRMGISINTAGAIIPVKASSGVANSQTVGNSSHYFNSMYSRWFHANTGKTGSDGGYGLYGGETTYSIAMRQTSNAGKHAYVQGDWATYFNMNSSTDRGWVFRSGTTPVASISTGGYIAGNRLSLNRSGSVDYGRIYWYSPTYYTWVDYAASSGDGTAPTGGKPSSSTEVTSWALRSLMENASGYGWIWEASDNASKSTTTSPTMRMSLSSNTGRLRLEGNAASTTTKTGQFIVSTEKNGDNKAVAIELWRGTASSWQIANDGGTFYIRNNYYSSAAQTTYSVKGLAIDHSTGAASLPYLALGQDARNTSYRLYVVGGQSYFGQNIVLAAGAKITQHQASTSNSTTAIQWYKGGTSQNTYNPQISQHNTGGDGSGTITILPYATATEPWGGAVGLFIQKGAMSLDGKRVITSNNSGGTVGSATKFIYSDAGVLKETSSTIGANTKFMYMSSGTMTASTASVGSGIKIMYLSSGTFTASTSNVGTATQPMYMYGGELKACNSTVGSVTRPVYMNAGTISQISYYIQANIKSYSGSLATGGWKALNGKADSPSIAIAYNNNKANWNSETYSSSLVFGCSDTRGLLDIGYSTPKITFGGSSFSAATDDNPKWYMSIYGTSTKSYNLDKMPLAETANKWTTARSISLVGGVRGSCTIDGSANKEIVVTPSFASARSTGSASGYHLITINSNNGWMTAFTIRLYQAYRYTDIVISGYNYGSNYWYSPSAVILGSSKTEGIDVKFGYTAVNALWVAVPASNYYGIDIINVTNGYNAFDSLKDLFSISNVSTLPGTTQTTITAYRPWYRGETVSVGNGGTGVNSQTANRLVWSTSATALSAANHYVNASKLGVATTSEPSYNFYVNGTAYITSSLQTGGNITAPRFVGLADRATFIDATAVGSSASYLTTHPAVAGRMAFYYNFSRCDGLFPATNNANFMITFNKHSGSYDSQLGFSSDGNIYYRSFNNSALNTTTAWRKVLTSSDITGDLDSRYVNITGDTLTGSPALKFPASAGSVSTSDPMSITYGRIATYSTLYINANTDNSGTEYIILTAGKGLSSNGGDGLAIGSSTLKWLGYDVLTTNNYSSTLDSRYVNTSGDTMTGALNFKNGTWNKVGDDAQFGDNNTSGSFAIQGLNGNTNLKMVTYNGTTYGTITWDGTNFVFSNKISGTVTNAEKDSAGNIINSTYISTIEQITSSGTTFTFRGRAANGNNRDSLITIPAATTSVAGLVTNAAQTFAGNKTFNNNVYGDFRSLTSDSLGGFLIYSDSTFMASNNDVGVYNNSNNGNVVIERISKPSDCPTQSSHCLKITTKGAASPNHGGIVQSLSSRAGAQFIVKYLIYLPSGYSLNVHSNSMGSGYVDKFITDRTGTGQWKIYTRYVKCGTTGSFSNGGHISVSGGSTATTSAPVVWYIGGIWAYDITKPDVNSEISYIHPRYNSNVLRVYGGLKVDGELQDKKGHTVRANLFVNEFVGVTAANAYTLKGLNTADEDITALNLPMASTSQAGMITATAQTLAGDKTLQGNFTVYMQSTTAQNYPAKITFNAKDTTTGSTSTASIAAYSDHNSTSYGSNLVVTSGGNTLIQAGDGTYGSYGHLIGTGVNTSENLYLTADNQIQLCASADTVNRKIVWDGTTFYPAISNTFNLGSKNYRWASGHIYRDFNIYGNESTGDESHLRFCASDGNQRAIIAFNGNTTNSLDATTHLKIASSYGDIRLDAGSNYINVKGHVLPRTDCTSTSYNIGSSARRWGNIYTNVLRLQGPSSDPSATQGARIEFAYDNGSSRSQPVYISYTPNDSYRAPYGLKIFSSDADAHGAWLEVQGAIGTSNTSSSSGIGISLYNGPVNGKPSYGMFFGGTATFGKLFNTSSSGSAFGVSSDWATYFTMSDTATRGWLFMRGSTNVAGVSGYGTFLSSVSTGSHINGNRGKVLIDGTAGAGYNMLFRQKSSNGVFTAGAYNGEWVMYYTADSTISNGTNSTTYGIRLLNESGNSLLNRLGVGGENVGYQLYINGTSRFTGVARFNTTVYFANGETYYVNGSADSRLRYVGVGNASPSSSYALNIGGETYANDTIRIVPPYQSTATSRYSNAALEIREAGGVTSNQSAIGYAPRIGFHWGGRVAGSLALHSDGAFYFRNQNDSGQANVYGNTFYGALSGNATTATTLQTSRTINGTSFNGSANIVTSYWGTARTITIGNTGRSVNGSANYSWSHTDIAVEPYIKYTIDLSSLDQNTWYPVTGDALPRTSGFNRIRLSVQLNSGTKPSWATHNSGFTTILDMLATASGWGTTSALSICLQHSSSHVTGSNPSGYTQLTNSSTPVLWLKGGGKYFVWTSYSTSWTIRTASTTISSQTVAPTTTYPGLSFSYSTIYANLSGNASSATKLQTARTIRTNLASTSTASFDGTANITPGVTGVLPTGNGGTGNSSFTSGTLIYASSATQLSSNATLKTGSGFIKATLSDTTTAYLQVTNNNGACDIRVTTNRGLYDVTNSKWMIYIRKNDNTLRTDSSLHVGDLLYVYNGLYNRRTSAGGGFVVFTNDVNYGRLYNSTVGTTDTTGETYLMLGNNTATGTDNNARGILRLYGTGAGYTNILRGSSNVGSNYNLYLPEATGQLVYHTNDTAVGGSTTPVYINSAGQAVACTSYTSALDGRYVNVTGDTMTGTLTISKASANNSQLLVFNTPRPWSFREGYLDASQVGTATLDLVSHNDDKSFRILNSNKTKGFRVDVKSSAAHAYLDGDMSVIKLAASGTITLTGNGKTGIQMGVNSSTSGGEYGWLDMYYGSAQKANLYCNSSGVAFLPKTNHTGTIGSSSNRFATMYAQEYYASGWFRTYGDSGWYSQTYGGGWYMSDTTWVRIYGNKNVYSGTGLIRSDSQLHVGSGGAYFYATSSGNGYFSNTLGIGGTNTSYKLYVNGTTYMTNTLNFADNKGIVGLMGGGSDSWKIYGSGSGDAGVLNIEVTDNATSDWLHFRFVNYDGTVYTPMKMTGNQVYAYNFGFGIRGTNSISSTTNDTTSNWSGYLSSIHWYSSLGLLNGQPSTYGYLFNIAGAGADIHQMWFTQSSGTVYHRGGNNSGWNGSWRAFLDSSNWGSYAPVVRAGTGNPVNTVGKDGDIYIKY